MTMKKTLFDKIWESHVVTQQSDSPAILYIDLHLVHEVTSPQAFTGLRQRGLKVRRPDKTLATMDHSIPTTPLDVPMADAMAAAQIKQMEVNAAEFGITLHGMDSPHRGIVHVIGPELGRTQPGMTIVCGDSHTATHGAFGALAFGIGTSEVEHVLATQCLLQKKPKTMIAPDDTTFEYLHGREFAPKDEEWDKAVSKWRALPTDEGATYDKSVTLDASELEPMITYGTNPGMGMKITERIPTTDAFKDSSQRSAFEKAMTYMGLQPGQSLLGHKVDVVFIGSCTNSRISDLRLAASMLKGRKVAESTRVLVVPGSQDVKKQAENEGLDQVFKEAGAEWREAGCSMCIAMNGDQLQPGQYAVSTSNRNFEGRQGKGGRTFLASPLTAAATALTGKVTDVRTILS